MILCLADLDKKGLRWTKTVAMHVAIIVSVIRPLLLSQLVTVVMDFLPEMRTERLRSECQCHANEKRDRHCPFRTRSFRLKGLGQKTRHATCPITYRDGKKECRMLISSGTSFCLISVHGAQYDITDPIWPISKLFSSDSRGAEAENKL